MNTISNKVKIINFQLLKQSPSISLHTQKQDRNRLKVKQLCEKLSQIVKDRSRDRVYQIREIICEQNLRQFGKIVEICTSFCQKKRKNENVNESNSEVFCNLRDRYQKISKKLSETVSLVTFLKQKLTSKEIQVQQKEQSIKMLKIQCQNLKTKNRKQIQIKQYRTQSNQLMKNLKISTHGYQSPKQIQIRVESPFKNNQYSNIFYRTAQDCNRSLNEMFKKNKENEYNTQGRSTPKSPKNLKRQLRKTFDKIPIRQTSSGLLTPKQKQRKFCINGLLVGKSTQSSKNQIR